MTTYETPQGTPLVAADLIRHAIVYLEGHALARGESVWIAWCNLCDHELIADAPLDGAQEVVEHARDHLWTEHGLARATVSVLDYDLPPIVVVHHEGRVL